ncbi:MAG: DUF4366 domain-containing protein [Candidatus Gastranaerophilales bacterium]|nr:DUF4366 domain-containing protein [Candidatus Gastranaerophilales bacterium]
MFFEDEKDIIREGADIRIDEDGTVTWEDVLNTEDDIPIIDNTPSKSQQKNTVDLGDELQLVEDNEDDVNDQELLNILNNVQEQQLADSKPQAQTQQTNTASLTSEEDFDIDSQLANVVLEQNQDGQTHTPRKNEKKQNSSSMPLMIILLVVALLGGGIYYGMLYLEENELLQQVSKKEIAPKPTIQQEMNNITQEDIQQRQAVQESIPVVNEEQANEVKVEEEEKKKEEEKKQVIKVTPTGRSNPFMPIQKYAQTSIPETTILYDKSGIPKPPETYGIQEEETTQMMTIAVSGIMYDEIKPSAIITFNDNDYFVQKGDKLDNYKITDIARNYVTIALGNNTYKANIGEEFKITSNFDGSAEFISADKGGGRQYRSVSEGSDEDKKPNKLRYVSEEEITIKAK